MATDRAFLGTELKYKVDITASGFSMVDNDFSIELTGRGGVNRTYTKGDLVQDGLGDYFLCFDSDFFGPGLITAVISAYVPDPAFPDGLRTEVCKIPLVTVLAV